MRNFKPNIFKFQRKDNTLFFSCVTDDDSKYALADQQGVIIIKGDFNTEYKMSIENLKPGYYTLTLLNAKTVEQFSVTV